MDVHVPLPITRGLRRRAVDVLTAQEDHAGRLSDPDLLDRAGELGRILFTQDEDLIAESVRRQRNGESFGTIIFARQLDLSIARCIAALELLAKSATPGMLADKSYSCESSIWCICNLQMPQIALRTIFLILRA